MSEVTAADRQIVFLDRARKLYSDGKFRPALAAFKEASFQIFTQAMTNDLLTHSHKALLRCPCTRDVLVQSKKMGLSLREIQISRCHCKDFESLPTVNSPKLAMYTLAKRACTCGSDVFHCNAPSHLNALDGIIATYEKLEAPVRARQYATLLIITSPRSPEGYLRLAKALRLRNTAQSPEAIARCRWIYRQAIQSVQAHGNQDHTKLKKIVANLLRMDILGSVPAELQTMILGYLGNADLCRSMRVSKTWKTACLDPRLWRHLIFVRASGRKLRNGVFNTVISKRAQGKVKSLTLWGMSKLGIDLPIFKATLNALKQLESLSLRGVGRIHDWTKDSRAAPPVDTWSMTLFKEAPPCLKTLEIAAFCPIYTPEPSFMPPAIPMAQSLEELSLSHLTTGSAIMSLLCSTVWPKLRKLTISSFPMGAVGGAMGGAMGSMGEPIRIDLQRLVQATPSLKDLCIYDLSPFDDNSTPSWERLERLALSLETDQASQALMGDMPSLPRLCPTIRSLEFSDKAMEALRAYERIASISPQINPQMNSNNLALPPVRELERLEHLYLRDDAIEFGFASHSFEALSWFVELIEPSMSNGCLTSLAVTFCKDTQTLLDKFLNKAAIRTLSCFDFLDQASGVTCGDTFATWVRGFTNLTTVGVFPQKSDSSWMHVSKVLGQESRIETIYTDVLFGQTRDWVLEKAQEKGVKLIEASRIPEPVLKPFDLEAGGGQQV